MKRPVSMIRAVLYLFLAIILISILRSIIGVIGKMLAAAVEPAPAKRAGVPESGGELKRDPVCGVFISPASSVKKAVGGQTVHFCSEACRDKYLKTSA